MIYHTGMVVKTVVHSGKLIEAFMSIEQTAHNISALKVIQCDDVSTTVQLFKAVFLLLLNHCLLLLRVLFFLFYFLGCPCCCYSVHGIISSFATIWMRKSELVALL